MTKSQVSIKRHILKTLSWRIIATLTTVIVAWILTGNPALSLKIGLVEVILKMILYFCHERAWYKWTDFGVEHKKIK